MSAKSSDTGEKILIMKNGSKHKVKGSTAKFWLCEGTQFRKSNPDIVEIVEAKPSPKKTKSKEAEEQPEEKEIIATDKQEEPETEEGEVTEDE